MVVESFVRTVATKEAWRLAKRRDDLFKEFFTATEDYHHAKEDVYHQDVRLQWVLEQVPLIEAELELEASVPDAASSSRPANDASRKTRGGRVIKNASRRRVGNRRGTRLQPDALAEPDDKTRSAPQRGKEQRKESGTEGRASRRLAKLLPEFGMLAIQDGASLPHASLPPPSDAGKVNSPATRGGRVSKRPTTVRDTKRSIVRGAKPQGISKPSKAGTGRPRRIGSGSRD